MIDYESPDAANFIPCLSIRQPYAWLIVNGFKPVENRTWPTRFRGRILIHAGVTYPKGEYADDAESFGSRYGIGYPAREAMIGGIVGSVARAVADAKADGRTSADEVLAVVRVALVAGVDKLAPAFVKALED